MKASNEWISISDMMSGLMMVFLFIAIVFMHEIQKEQEKVRDIVETYQNIKQQLNMDLNEEFKDDLGRWDAEILDDNTIRFNSPDILFDKQSAVIKQKFRQILENFFPRYIKILNSKKYRENIEEIRIEGHTSSIWLGANGDKDISYLKNMKLSQERAVSVLDFCYGLGKNNNQKWLIEKLRANGMSFSKFRRQQNGKEDPKLSRRVEFRVLTKTEEKINNIIHQLNQ